MIQTTPDKRTQANVSRDKQTQVKLALDKLVQGVVKTSERGDCATTNRNRKGTTMTERTDNTGTWASSWTGTKADPCISVSLNGLEVATIDRGATTSRIQGAVVLRFKGTVKAFANGRAIWANVSDAIDYVVSETDKVSRVRAFLKATKGESATPNASHNPGVLRVRESVISAGSRFMTDDRDLNAVLCGECAGHGDDLEQAGMDRKALRAITTTAQGYDWATEYDDGVALSSTDDGECTGCGHSNATETDDN